MNDGAGAPVIFGGRLTTRRTEGRFDTGGRSCTLQIPWDSRNSAPKLAGANTKFNRCLPLERYLKTNDTYVLGYFAHGPSSYGFNTHVEGY